MFTREAVLELSRRFDEPAWMRDFRLAAWATAESLPWPAPTDEAWRRTDPAAFQFPGIRPFADAPAGALPERLQRAIEAWEAPAGLLVQRNSQTVRRALDPQAGPGVVFTDLHTAVRERPDLVREHFMTSGVRPDETKFRALHAALWSGGTFLYVPDGVEVTLPLVSLTWIDADGVGVFPHTLVIAGRGSRVTLIAGSASAAGEWPAFADGVTEVITHDGAQVRLVMLQEWERNVVEIAIMRAILARDATLHSLVVGFGGKVVKTNVECILAGAGATSEMLGLLFADGTQHFDVHTLQEHRAPHTLSDLLYKNAVKDRARSVFSGMIRVHYGAQKTNAFQANRNLILSEGAKADSIPNLEIMANDLRCTHGSATSRLNEEHLFYLMSRGLTRAQAVRTVVEGFFAELLDRVPMEALRQRLQREIETRMMR
jgi:Fe-S cluster assembly protein SufD